MGIAGLRQCEGWWRSKRIEQCGRSSVLTQSDVHSLPTAQTIGTRFYKRGEAMSEQVKLVHLTVTLRDIREQCKLTRLQRGCNVQEKYSRSAWPQAAWGKIKRIWQKGSGQTWTGLADIGSWSEGSSVVVDIQEVLWSVGSFPTILRAV